MENELIKKNWTTKKGLSVLTAPVSPSKYHLHRWGRSFPISKIRRSRIPISCRDKAIESAPAFRE